MNVKAAFTNIAVNATIMMSANNETNVMKMQLVSIIKEVTAVNVIRALLETVNNVMILTNAPVFGTNVVQTKFAKTQSVVTTANVWQDLKLIGTGFVWMLMNVPLVLIDAIETLYV